MIRMHFEHPAITTDIIVGFPGETEEEFLETLNFVKNIQFYEVHVFKYSIRKGTKAAKMENQVPSKIKTERSHKLIALTKQLSEEFRTWYQGKNVEVLLEEEVTLGESIWMVGHTREYVKCAVKQGNPNTLIQVKVGEFLDAEVLSGEKISDYL
jgi:threonylcarbamoyladenosine tRNA methylthiotransferase MtaB